MTSNRLVHIVDEVPELDERADGERLPLVVALDGFLDAGNSAALAARFLADSASGGSVVATFDVDQLHDFRARRPAVTFARDHYEDYDAPRLVVRLLHDIGGAPYLLLHGPEPDARWEGFLRALGEVITRFRVSVTVGLGSVPMAVPHTRPIAITPHANRAELLSTESPWRGELRVPSSVQALMEIRLGEWGHPAQGFVAHVPHYLAQLDFPQAAVMLLEQVELAARLTLDLADLKALAVEREEEITRYLAANAEVGDVVTALEQQYDAFSEAEQSGMSLLASDEPLPTGDEIGHQFEQFLAGLDQPDGDADAGNEPDADRDDGSDS